GGGDGDGRGRTPHRQPLRCRTGTPRRNESAKRGQDHGAGDDGDARAGRSVPARRAGLADAASRQVQVHRGLATMTLARAVAPSLLCLTLAAVGAAAQDYPTRPVLFTVPYPPGGGKAVAAGILSGPLGAVLGHPIVIDNRGGAAGNLGT